MGRVYHGGVRNGFYVGCTAFLLSTRSNKQGMALSHMGAGALITPLAISLPIVGPGRPSALSFSQTYGLCQSNVVVGG